MATGPGKYDEVATMARTLTLAEGVVLLVFGGFEGSGFSVQASADVLLQLPDVLETMAREIRADLARAQRGEH
jgi:hypothetical protein